MHKPTTLLIGAAAAALVVAGCTSGSEAGSDDAPATANAASASCPASAPAAPAGEEAVAQPDNQGQALLDAICAAQSSIDVVIYQIGNSTVRDALVAAMQRGVKVRVMMDGYSESQKINNGEFASELRRAAQQASVPEDALALNWASNNFNITHQKSVIIDAAGPAGEPLAPGDLPASARLVMSTGNFSDYEGDPFYSARDFYVTTGDPQLVFQAASVFASDFACDGPTVTNDLRSATDLVWSNGTTGLYADQVGQYPPVDTGYFAPGRVSDPAPVVQGNSFDYQYSLLQNAAEGDVVRIYNEEFISQPFTNAVKEAAQRGVDVRIVMSYEQKGMPQLKEAIASVPADSPLPGVSATLYAPQAVVPDALYIHAKSIMVSASDGSFKSGFVGSENLSNPSMDYNRELGLPLQPGDEQVVSTILNTFDSDFATSDVSRRSDKSNPWNIPPEWEGSGGQAGSGAGADGSQGAQGTNKPGRCGAVQTD